MFAQGCMVTVMDTMCDMHIYAVEYVPMDMRYMHTQSNSKTNGMTYDRCIYAVGYCGYRRRGHGRNNISSSYMGVVAGLTVYFIIMNEALSFLLRMCQIA